MLITAGVVQMTILFQQPIMPLYVAELQGSMDRIVLVTGILFSAVGLSGVFSGLGDCGTKMGVPTGALFRTPWHDDIRRDPGHSE